jgi:hypothetical protein
MYMDPHFAMTIANDRAERLRRRHGAPADSHKPKQRRAWRRRADRRENTGQPGTRLAGPLAVRGTS